MDKDFIVYITITLIFIILITCFVFVFKSNNDSQPPSSASFITINESGDSIIVYNIETKVMYAVSNGLHNKGVYTMLVNADGTPMIWEG